MMIHINCHLILVIWLEFMFHWHMSNHNIWNIGSCKAFLILETIAVHRLQTSIPPLFVSHLLNCEGCFSEMDFWLFVWSFSSDSRVVFLIMRRHHYGWRASNFDLCSALMVIEEWGFFSVQHILWHGTYVYNGHIRGPVTLTPIAERLTVHLSLPVLTT